MRRLLTMGVASTLLVMVLPAAATATTPMEVTFHYTFDLMTGEGTFHAMGSAVDDGVMCAAGTFVDEGFKASAFPKGVGTVAPIDRFICDEGGGFDSSDTFLMKAQIHFPDFVGRWVIKGGTGEFAGIHGTGTVEGQFAGPALFETRAGRMHLD